MDGGSYTRLLNLLAVWFLTFFIPAFLILFKESWDYYCGDEKNYCAPASGWDWRNQRFIIKSAKELARAIVSLAFQPVRRYIELQGEQKKKKKHATGRWVWY